MPFEDQNLYHVKFVCESYQKKRNPEIEEMRGDQLDRGFKRRVNDARKREVVKPAWPGFGTSVLIIMTKTARMLWWGITHSITMRWK
jgi:hypothetical protein